MGGFRNRWEVVGGCRVWMEGMGVDGAGGGCRGWMERVRGCRE